MVKAQDRDAIVKFCQEYLNVKAFADHCHNGLQVEGLPEVRKIVTGVTFSMALAEAAVARGAQMIMVHHGICSKAVGQPPQIGGVLKERLKVLLQEDLSLCGFHLPLDAHAKIGNNVGLCKLLGVSKLKPFDVGYIGSLAKSVAFETFVRLVEKRIGVKAIAIAAGPKQVKRVAVLSGGSSGYVEDAARAGADLFLGGDLVESAVRTIDELGINFIGGGHYNTEKLGILNLGKLVSKKFGIPAEFVDIPCSF